MPNTYPGLYRGRIVNTASPTADGRVQVIIPAVTGANPIWAPICAPFVPVTNAAQVGATAWVMFEAGDPNMPVVMGTSR